jgi:hypothetical protein
MGEASQSLDYGSEAFAAATRALEAGYPAVFYGGGIPTGPRWAGEPAAMGYVYMASGDLMEGGKNRALEAGHNRGVLDYLKRGGQSWNSRARWLTEIHDPERWFQTARQDADPVVLTPGGPMHVSAEGTTELRLLVRTVGPCQQLILEVRSTQLWGADPGCITVVYPHSIYPHFLRNVPDRPTGWRHEFPKPGPNGSWEARTVHVRDNTRRVWYIGAEPPLNFVEFVWGPSDSPLAFFHLVDSDRRTLFCVLDYELGEWLPPKDPWGGRWKQS